MPHLTRSRLSLLALCAVLILLAGLSVPARGQEPLPQLFITGNDITSLPSIILHVYGRDAQGQALDFTTEPLLATHDGTAVTPQVDGTYPGGTFTMFLLDKTTGVSGQIPAMQDAILQFASPTGGMQEQVDAMAIYQVGDASARELLAPTSFHNAVRNFFVEDLQPETEATALIDSLVSLIDQIETIQPEPDMVPSIVVMSDGTDVISTQFEGSDVLARAIEKNVAIHTIWVDSTDLTQTGQQQGQAFLRDVANGTRGLATTLDNATGLMDMWSRIASFREQARLRYDLENLDGGTYDVTLSLANDPAVNVSTSVTVPENQPLVLMEIPEESREVSLPNLDEPVRLGLGATVSWLDGVEREVALAVLRINGRDVVQIPPEQIDSFTAEISNLAFGPNTFEIAIEDTQSLRAVSPPVVVNISEGSQNIPSELQPGGGVGNLVRNGVLILIVLAALVVVFFILARSGRLSGLLPRGRSRRRRAAAAPDSEAGPVGAAGAAAVDSTPFVMAHLEVLQTDTEMPEKINLNGPEVRLGRAPGQSDVAFREDITVSRNHAVLMLEGNHYRIFDQQSTSGTFVNGRPVPEYGTQLVDGDEIMLGAVQLRYRQL